FFAGVTGRTDDGDFFGCHLKVLLNNKPSREQRIFIEPPAQAGSREIKNPPAEPAGGKIG
ncbi:MAG TPA: hypothetical protein VF607_00705, partial [Verrucomicrobiae bacterium]